MHSAEAIGVQNRPDREEVQSEQSVCKQSMVLRMMPKFLGKWSDDDALQDNIAQKSFRQRLRCLSRAASAHRAYTSSKCPKQAKYRHARKNSHSRAGMPWSFQMLVESLQRAMV